jgi:hypothetical protein
MICDAEHPLNSSVAITIAAGAVAFIVLPSLDRSSRYLYTAESDSKR